MSNDMAMSQFSELGQAALYYAEQGLKVFPCSPNSKAPLIPKEEGGKGHHDATTDPAKIREWWTQWPDANIGLNLRGSDLVCVDADIYKPECQWEALRAGRDIPPTWVQQSPSGGMHYIFRAVEGVEYGGNTFKGVDLKWNGYVLLSPSKVDGKRYELVPGERPRDGSWPAYAPDWLPRTQAVFTPTINPHRRHEDRSDAFFAFVKRQWEAGSTVDEIFAMAVAAPEATGADRFNGNEKRLLDDINRIVGKPSGRFDPWMAEIGRKIWAGVTHVGGVSKAALLGTTALFQFHRGSSTEETVKTEYYIDPWLPKGLVVGVYGRGASGKSTWVSTMVARASAQVSTLWISSEEYPANISTRYTKSGGDPNALLVLTHMPRLQGSEKVATFDAYEHLERTITDAKAALPPGRPLGVVVLDAIVTLVSWGKGENANDDGSVKRLIAHLQSLAERHGITILMLGHYRKNSNSTHAADQVMGAAAWTTSLRQAFSCNKDTGSDGDYDFYIKTVKANMGPDFACTYRTVPVHTLHARADAPDDVLCKIELTSAIAWGGKAIYELIPEEDPNQGVKAKRKQKEDAKLACVVQAIKAGCETRAQIIEYCGHPDRGIKISDSDFSRKLDAALQARRGVQIINVAHNKMQYRCT